MSTKFTVTTAKVHKQLGEFNPLDLQASKKLIQSFITKSGVKETVDKIELKGNSAVEVTIKGNDPTAVKALFK